MKILAKLLTIATLTVGLCACGIKGDIKPPQPDAAYSSNFTVR